MQVKEDFCLRIENRITSLECRVSELTKALDRQRTIGWGAIASLVATIISQWVSR